MTEAARAKLSELLAAEAVDAGLRVSVIPGGCSGFEYSLALGAAEDGDQAIVEGGARIYVDRVSLPYLLGAEFDYEDRFQGAGFVINNPNATASCGCGKSFQA
jgi:iron-sulfur cluster assembly accessory protein